MKRALLTGMGGFCGRQLTRLLDAEGLEVAGMGTFACDALPFRMESVTDIPGIRAVFEEFQPEVIFHLAGVIRAENPTEIHRVNTGFATALLHAHAQAGLEAPVLLVGTAAEYGMVRTPDLPLDENHPCQPVNHYGISKLAQSLVALAAAQSGQPVIVARPFNILGAGMPEHLLAGSIARQIAALSSAPDGTPLELGNLDSTRDYLDVRDVVAYYWELARNPAAYGEVVNICSGSETSVESLARQMLELAACPAAIVSREERQRAQDVSRHVGDPQKLLQLTGRRPRVSLEDSLRAVLKGCGP